MYATARAATVRMIVDTMEPWKAAADYTDWDAHAEGFKLPSTDLIGLIGFSCSRNGPFHDLTFGVGIMVLNDPGLGRMTDYVDTFYARLAAHKTFPVFNADGTLTDFEIVCFDGTSAAPMSRVDYRPTTEITVSARVTRAGEWPLP
ncbi:hypothetical protein [Methylorubrum suomiense]|uniref:Uncharacterized protein n=1 Tax=Methylorubrum suomiense TaxID=144191 RepID=A0ABQ4V1Z9_9HYPH|nr:hypothetical protein [Methylorubrum suomiense]GJE78085.1 hypothetical protein BGCPKDLD_4696 [Methylorubrum suomiense]